VTTPKDIGRKVGEAVADPKDTAKDVGNAAGKAVADPGSAANAVGGILGSAAGGATNTLGIVAAYAVPVAWFTVGVTLIILGIVVLVAQTKAGRTVAKGVTGTALKAAIL
jgi:hypothetical protein